MIDINLRGAFVATQAALTHMNKGGRIILIGSCVGERMMTPGLVAYAATKGAIKMFAQGLAREVGDRGITVNNIQPGPIDTDLNPASGEWAVPQKAMTALNRYGSVDDVAALVALRRRSGSCLHHRRKPDGRRRHERLTRRSAYPSQPCRATPAKRMSPASRLDRKSLQRGRRVRAFDLGRLPSEMCAKANPAMSAMAPPPAPSIAARASAAHAT